ncbi:uncharacterized protein N0V89_006519 [Didymosphaeria variabile]|uniref:Uncharacterized protein n=1 Tax=Didymosphaeria variabile TaxID=1932322 RepID=A0A9W8XH85_9PLEO|nr:uncharacterized protein N0V89_006519 [Didymosphaeria variabile]KAJ4351180.1 hypothetical protein N0V89_006519 [Didymosphaeria variabile]
MSTPSVGATETTLVPEQTERPSSSSQDTHEKGKSDSKKVNNELEQLTKKQKARRFTHNILDAIVKAGTGGGMGT